MEMGNIMVKASIYITCILISAFTISGINFSNMFKKNYLWEARIFVIILSFIMGYLLGNFFIDFLSSTEIL